MTNRTEFDRCWPLLEPAVGTPAPYTKEDVWRVIAEDRATFWPLEQSAIVGNVLTFPTGLRTANCWLVGGVWDEIEAFTPHFEARARSIGCHRAEFYGRPGFERRMRHNGYTLRRVHVAKDLT